MECFCIKFCFCVEKYFKNLSETVTKSHGIFNVFCGTWDGLKSECIELLKEFSEETKPLILDKDFLRTFN